MKVRFRVSPRAGRQIREAAKWWSVHRTAAPTLLADELEAAYALISDMQFAGERVPHSRMSDLRRILLGRTQYHLYYVVSDDDSIIDIVAFWHSSRGSAPRL